MSWCYKCPQVPLWCYRYDENQLYEPASIAMCGINIIRLYGVQGSRFHKKWNWLDARHLSLSLLLYVTLSFYYYLLFHWCFSTLAKIPTDIDMQYKMFSYLNITSWYICSHLGLWEPNHVGFVSRSPWNPGSAHLSAPPRCKPGRGPALPPGRVLREEHCIPHEGTVPVCSVGQAI